MPTTDAASAAAVPTASDAPVAAWEDAARHAGLRARRRRRDAGRAAWLSTLRRRGVAVFAATMVLGAGGAAAHKTPRPAKPSTARVTVAVSVQAIQRALGVPADGIFGPRTRRAVRRFQARKGLVVDGIVGPATIAALGLKPSRASTRAPRRAGTSAALRAIARCESGGNPRAVSPDGRYRGKYQFSRATWRALGGKGDPAKAPEAEQDRLAALLYAREGTRPWPACSRAVR